MRALIYLETRHIAALAPVVGVMLIFGLAPVFMRQEQGGTVGVAFLTMTAVVLVSRVFPFEPSSSRANTLVGTLPVTRRQVVSARYALALSIILVTAALVVVIAPEEGLPERLGMAGVVVAVPLLNLIAVGPLSSRGGFGQIGPMVPVLPFALLMLLVVFMPESWKQSLFSGILEAPVLSAILGVTLLVALIILSFLLSVRWFSRRDL